MIYIGFVIAMALASYYSQFRPIAQTRLFYVFIISMFVLVAFRFDVGCDWSGYYLQWEKISNGTGDGLWEQRSPSWYLLVRTIQLLGFDYPVLNLVSATIFFGCLLYFCQSQPNRLAFLFFMTPVLIVNMPMSGIRQAIAIGFMLVAMRSFLNRNTLAFLAWIMIGATFHSSVVILVFMAPFVRGTMSSQRLILAVLFAIPVLILIGVSEAAEVATTRYVNADREAFGAAFRVLFLSLSGLAFIGFIRPVWRLRSPDDYKLVLLGSFAMIVLLALIPFSTIIADRLSYYFIPFQAIVFSRLVYLEGAGKIPVFTQIAYIAVIALFVVWATTSSHFNTCYVPYQSWITGYPIPVIDTI